MTRTRRLVAALSVATLAFPSLLPGGTATAEAATATAPATEAAAAEAPWGPVVKVARGRALEPVMTSAGHMFQATEARRGGGGWSRYSWKPLGGNWSRPKDFMPRGHESRTTTELVATGQNRVTYVWSEVVDGGELQYFIRWYDVDGRRGKIRPAGDPIPDHGYAELTVAASPHGALVVVATYAGVERILLRDSVGEWTDLPIVPVANFFPTGAAINDTGVATVVGFERDQDSEHRIFAATSSAAGPWSVERIGPRPGHFPGSPNVPMVVETGDRGDLVVLWGEEGNTVLAAHRSADPAADWSVDVLSEQTDCYWICVRAGTAANGDAAVVWVRPTAGAPAQVDVQIARLDAAAGTWSRPQTLLNRMHNYHFGSLWFDIIDVAASGDVVVAYPDEFTEFVGRYTFRCPPDPSADCQPEGLLDGPQSRAETVFLRAGPDGAAVATWTPRCVDGCDLTGTLSQSIEPAAFGR